MSSSEHFRSQEIDFGTFCCFWKMVRYFERCFDWNGAAELILSYLLGRFCSHLILHRCCFQSLGQICKHRNGLSRCRYLNCQYLPTRIFSNCWKSSLFPEVLHQHLDLNLDPSGTISTTWLSLLSYGSPSRILALPANSFHPWWLHFVKSNHFLACSRSLQLLLFHFDSEVAAIGFSFSCFLGSFVLFPCLSERLTSTWCFLISVNTIELSIHLICLSSSAEANLSNTGFHFATCGSWFRLSRWFDSSSLIAWLGLLVLQTSWCWLIHLSNLQSERWLLSNMSLYFHQLNPAIVWWVLILWKVYIVSRVLFQNSFYSDSHPLPVSE